MRPQHSLAKTIVQESELSALAVQNARRPGWIFVSMSSPFVGDNLIRSTGMIVAGQVLRPKRRGRRGRSKTQATRSYNRAHKRGRQLMSQESRTGKLAEIPVDRVRPN